MDGSVLPDTGMALAPAFAALNGALRRVQSDPEDAFDDVAEFARAARADRHAVFFIGNGGSAAIASHMAADWMKAGGFAAHCFNDPAQLTCLANDLGYERVFELPLRRHAKPGDLLFAVSSSGQSRSITNAARAAAEIGVNVVTLSGFAPDNPLRAMGVCNFYVPSDRYGLVEVAHHAILHAILDRLTDAP